jgi:hypothetical protein
MRPADWDPDTDDPNTFMDDLIEWERRRNELESDLAHATEALVVADTQLDTVRDWADGMGRFASTVAIEANQLTGIDGSLRSIDAELGRVAGELADHTAARELATARLLEGPRADVPLVLLPLRLETRWADGALHVRIYPDDIAVDAHDPGLTEDEITWAEHFWQVRPHHTVGDGTAGDTVDADPEETWQQLVRRFGPARAAWLVRASAPGQPPLKPRPDPWPRPARVRLLPDRFAVVALAGGLPVNLAPAGSPPRYVTWGTPVADPLPLAPLDPGASPGGGGAPPWWSDLDAARLAGMAISIPLGKATPTIEALAVVGVRGATRPAPPWPPCSTPTR